MEFNFLSVWLVNKHYIKLDSEVKHCFIGFYSKMNFKTRFLGSYHFLYQTVFDFAIKYFKQVKSMSKLSSMALLTNGHIAMKCSLSTGQHIDLNKKNKNTWTEHGVCF